MSVAILSVALISTAVLSGCSQDRPSPTRDSLAAELPSSHVHGIARDPGSRTVNLATHEGLFTLRPNATWQKVGLEVDLMGFAVGGPGIFYGSGHPAAGVDLPFPAGLIKSTNAGRTWTSLSRGKQSDFHALTASSKGVMGFDGALRVTADGKSWSEGTLPADPRSLAWAPDGSQVLATTDQGVLSSADAGRTWLPLRSAPQLLLTAWADSKTVVGVSTQGRLAVSQDAGRSWRTDLASVPSAQALSAGRDKGRRLEILVVTETAVRQSLDSGATLTNLKP